MDSQDDKNYEEFFDKIKKFKVKQTKQKQRGLNDYNILAAVRKPHAEVGMHSNFIYSIINPYGLHYQGDLFVNLFIKHVLKINNFGKVTKVEMEEDAKGRRIDFTIKSDNYYIGIEMKIYASDQHEQIKDYYDNLINKSQKNEKVIIYYLTLDGKEASKDSSKGIEYKKISFKTDILNWLNKCQDEVQNITNLNMAIEQYKDVVKIITGDYKPKAKQIYQYILENEGLFKEAQKFYHENEGKYNQLSNIEKEAYQAYEKAREEIADKFFLKKLPNYLKDNFPKLNIEVKFNEKDYKYKIIATNHSKGKIIFGSEGYGTNNDFVVVDGKKLLTKYRYRYSKKSIEDFYYKDSNTAKEYYKTFIKENL